MLPAAASPRSGRGPLGTGRPRRSARLRPPSRIRGVSLQRPAGSLLGAGAAPARLAGARTSTPGEGRRSVRCAVARSWTRGGEGPGGGRPAAVQGAHQPPGGAVSFVGPGMGPPGRARRASRRASRQLVVPTAAPDPDGPRRLDGARPSAGPRDASRPRAPASRSQRPAGPGSLGGRLARSPGRLSVSGAGDRAGGRPGGSAGVWAPPRSQSACEWR